MLISLSYVLYAECYGVILFLRVCMQYITLLVTTLVFISETFPLHGISSE